MAALQVPASLAFSFNRVKTLERFGNALDLNQSFIIFFIELNKFDRKFLESELIERLENFSDEDLILCYEKFKDSQVRELIRVILSTREDFMKKMHDGNFICIA